MIHTPDLRYSDRLEASLRPSWSANRDFLNDEHRQIFEKTKDIPGWQMEGDAYKLYELGYFAGDIILEIGVYGGRSAAVELRGALGNAARVAKPQLYGIDLDPAAIPRSYASLAALGIEKYALLYQGDIRSFMEEVCIQPTMVFVDGDHQYNGVRADLEVLTSMLSPGVPVLCHDYLNRENDSGDYGVRRAATEWEEAGYAEFAGVFGCSALFVTTPNCHGPYCGLSPGQFASQRERLLVKYGVLEGQDTLVHALQDRIKELTQQLEASVADGAARLEVINQFAAQIQQFAAQIQELYGKSAEQWKTIQSLQATIDQLSTTRGASRRLLGNAARKAGIYEILSRLLR